MTKAITVRFEEDQYDEIVRIAKSKYDGNKSMVIKRAVDNFIEEIHRPDRRYQKIQARLDTVEDELDTLQDELTLLRSSLQGVLAQLEDTE